MSRFGAMYGPDLTFLGVPRCDLGEVESYAGADVVIVGAPLDGGSGIRDSRSWTGGRTSSNSSAGLGWSRNASPTGSVG